MENFPNSKLTAAERTALSERDYYLSGKIGKGAFATVFAAEGRHFATGRKIRLACKVFDVRKTPREYCEKFFPRELDIIMNISHPNIIAVESILQRGPKYFIFMRYADNGDLLEWVQKYGATEENLCKVWFGQISSALDYLHKRDIVHRDLKCENILLSKHLKIKIGDFGFARYCVDENGRRTMSKTFCGSPAYAAPEIVSGEIYNPKISDIWSIGVILFVLLNGIMPFDDSNSTQLFNCQVHKRWSFLRKIKKRVSYDAQNLVERILEPNVRKRISLEGILSHTWLNSSNMGAGEGGDAATGR